MWCPSSTRAGATGRVADRRRRLDQRSRLDAERDDDRGGDDADRFISAVRLRRPLRRRRRADLAQEEEPIPDGEREADRPENADREAAGEPDRSARHAASRDVRVPTGRQRRSRGAGPAPAVVDPVDREPGRLREAMLRASAPQHAITAAPTAPTTASRSAVSAAFEPTHEPGRGCGGAPVATERGDASRHERGERAEAVMKTTPRRPVSAKARSRRRRARDTRRGMRSRGRSASGSLPGRASPPDGRLRRLRRPRAGPR